MVTIFITQRSGIDAVHCYDRDGRNYADVPTGTIIATDEDGYKFVLPGGKTQLCYGIPMVLRAPEGNGYSPYSPVDLGRPIPSKAGK